MPALAADPQPRLGGRRLLILAALATAVIVGFFAVQNLAGSTVYYLTPTEAAQRGTTTAGQTARLGGLVETGTLVYEPTTRELRFTISDGVSRVAVIGSGAPPGLLREGAGAVVEGTFATDGTFHASQVIAKHDEVYQAPPPGATPSHRTTP